MFVIVFQAHYTLCRARRQEISITTDENSVEFAPFHIVKFAEKRLSLSPVQPRPAMKPGQVPGLSDFIRQDCLPNRAIVSKHCCAMLCNGKTITFFQASSRVEQCTLGCENPLDHPHDTLVCFPASTAQVDSLGRPQVRIFIVTLLGVD